MIAPRGENIIFAQFQDDNVHRERIIHGHVAADSLCMRLLPRDVKCNFLLN